MADYVVLVRYTDQGIQSIKDAPARVEQARRDFEATGGKLKEFFLTMGTYDAVALVEAPDDETLARISLGIASRGSARTETLRAFGEQQFERIVSQLT